MDAKDTELVDGEVRSLRCGEAGVLEVRRGRVWLSAPEDSQDYILEAGTRVALRSCDGVVVQAVGGGGAIRWRRAA